MQQESGKTYSKKDVEAMMKEKIATRNKKNGIVQILEESISRSTVENITALLSDQAISIVSTVNKPNNCETAEKSLRSAVALLSMVSSTHFIPVTLEDDDIRKELLTLPKSTRMLSEMVAIAWKTPVYPLHPSLIFLTDDTTEYTFEGIKDGEPSFVLAAKSSVAKRGTNALYTSDPSKAIKGMRV